MDTKKAMREALLKHTKKDLAEKIGITRTTLNRRIEKGDWKKGELKILLSL